jgi:hypothetical protein
VKTGRTTLSEMERGASLRERGPTVRLRLSSYDIADAPSVVPGALPLASISQHLKFFESSVAGRHMLRYLPTITGLSR